MSEKSTWLNAVKETPLLRFFYRPPFIGIIALLVALIANPLDHALVVLITRDVPANLAMFYSLSLGFIGVAMVIYASKKGGETLGTLMGFVAGNLVWVGWCAFGFRFNRYYYELSPLAGMLDPHYPTNLHFLQGSAGVLMGTMIFFIFNKDTRCNFYRWIQRKLRIDMGRRTKVVEEERDFARITFIETIYVIWFFYALSLFLGDPRFLGHEHPAYIYVYIASVIWAIYLLNRLFKHTRIMAGIRYAIPTKSLVWFSFEKIEKIGGKEIWLHPQEYAGPLLGVLAFFVLVIFLAVIVPARKTVRKTVRTDRAG